MLTPPRPPAADRRRGRRARRVTAALAAATLLAVACGGDGGDATDGAGAGSGGDAAGAGSEAEGLVVQTASYDLAVGEDRRYIAGVLTPDQELVGLGEVTMAFFYLGEDGAGEPEPLSQGRASFLPVPGREPGTDGDRPVIVSEAQTTGVYEITADFPRPGFYGVRVAADVEGRGRLEGQSVFQVAPATQVPAPGDPAPRSKNLTASSDAPSVAVDSRAAEGEPLPDPELHDTTIAAALDQGRPVVAVFSTPVYCVSRFCGPITDAVQELAAQYGDRAAFVHVEVWRDFEAQELNDAAAEWIRTDTGGAEPWVFLIGGDGVVRQRWDNVLDLGELRAALEELPPGGAGGA